MNALEKAIAIAERIQAMDPPSWFDGKILNESAFVKDFLKEKNMRCIYGKLFDTEGEIENERIRKEIYSKINPYVTTGLANKTESLLSAIKIETMTNDLPIDEDRIDFHNGSFYVKSGEFKDEKEFAINRLPVNYNRDADIPKRWFGYITELLYPEDIPVLQEYMGYMMTPSTRAQKMMMIIGKGGEGKSVLGEVLTKMLGRNMNVGSFAKLASNRFATADLVLKLGFLDDDMTTEALKDTSKLKTLVTLKTLTDVERKGEQSTQEKLYSKLIGLGNIVLAALYDKSDGFFRRQLIIKTRPRDPDRVDDKNLPEELEEEIEGIVMWALDGLIRLVENDYSFTESARITENLEEAKRESNNVIDFFESEGYLEFNERAYVSTDKLYSTYEIWCEDNAQKPITKWGFQHYLAENADSMKIQKSKTIPGKENRTVRGYRGIRTILSFEQ